MKSWKGSASKYIKKAIHKSEDDITRLEAALQSQWSAATNQSLIDAHKELALNLNREESLLRDQSRMKARW